VRLIRMTESVLEKVAIAVLVAAAATTQGHAQSRRATSESPVAELPSLGDWLADLDFLKREMPLRHRNLYHDSDSAAFARQFSELRRDLPSMSTAQRVAGLLRLGSMVHDAHSGIAGIPPSLTFESLPIVVYLYDDGLFVQAADSGNASLVGARIVSIGEVSADSAIRLASAVTDASNPMTVAAFVKSRLVRPALLAALGISDRADRTKLVVEQNGETRQVELHSLGRSASGTPKPGRTGFWPSIKDRTGWVDLQDHAAGPGPLWLQHPDSAFWSSYDANSRTLYAQCNFVLDGPNEKLASFFHQLLARADQSDVDRLILDLRQNGGGDNSLLRPIIRDFVRSQIAQIRGRFFVITGRMTQSAAQNFVNRLELYTTPIFVGEPTGERPNMYGDPETFRLPHTGITVALASLYWQDMDPRDVRQWTGPYLAAPLTSRAYKEQRDPAVDLILHWRVDEPLSAQLSEALDTKDSSETTRRYRSFVRDPLHRWSDVSTDVFALADSLTDESTHAGSADKARLQQAALQLLRLNLSDHTEMARAHSALAQLLEATGQHNSALAEARNALQIDAHDPIARAIETPPRR
jgi:hypothetical protein